MYRLSNRYLKIALFISAIFFSFAYAQTSSLQKDPAGVLLSPSRFLQIPTLFRVCRRWELVKMKILFLMLGL